MILEKEAKRPNVDNAYRILGRFFREPKDASSPKCTTTINLSSYKCYLDHKPSMKDCAANIKSTFF